MRKTWSLQEIKTGLERFILENGRLPKALEVDSTAYLPSSRFIQLKFGGLEKLRGDLGYTDTHFGKGRFRSSIASRVNLRGRDTELALQDALRKKFGEVFVHTERIFDNSKNRVDFYVYSPDGNFGIDIFYPGSMQNLQSNVNIKMKKYKNFVEPLYLTSANTTISQEQLDIFSAAKVHKLPTNVKLFTLQTLLKTTSKMNVYPNPLPS